MDYKIRELQLGEILDHAIYLFRDEFKLIAIVLLFMLIPFYMVLTLAAAILSPPIDFSIFLGGAPPAMYTEPSYFLISMAQNLGNLVLTVVVIPITQAALIYAMALRYQGRAVTVKASVKHALRKAPSVILASFVFVVAVGIGTACCCVVPGLLISLFWYLYMPLLVLEPGGFGADLVNAFTRSPRLMRGSLMKAFVLSLILYLIGLAVGSAVAPAFLFTKSLLPRILAGILGSVAYPLVKAFGTIVTTVFYFSERSRVEHLDLQLRLRDMMAVSEPAEAAL